MKKCMLCRIIFRKTRIVFKNNVVKTIFRRWVEVKKTKDYESLIFKIEEKLNSGIFETDKIRDEFKMELGIVYMLDQKYDESKNLFNDIINYSTPTDKMNLLLARLYITFKEFDLELSQEYFDLVSETMRTSDYSKVQRIFK